MMRVLSIFLAVTAVVALIALVSMVARTPRFATVREEIERQVKSAIEARTSDEPVAVPEA